MVLTAYNGLRLLDRVSVTIEVMTTALNVIVEEYYDHYRVTDASVILYPTKNDWDNEINPLVEGFTDEYGIAKFENLNPVLYYIDGWHENHNNYLLAAEDVNYIRTDPLVRNAVNEFVAYVDYIGSVSRIDGKRIAQYKILKMEPRKKDTTKQLRYCSDRALMQSNL